MFGELGVLVACLAVAMAHPAFPPNDIVNQLQNTLQNGPMQPFNYLQQAVGDVAERASNAYVTTYDQQKNSIDQTFENVKTTGQKGIESTLGLLKNGLEFIFILPRFGRNALANAQQQSPQQQQIQQLQQQLLQQHLIQQQLQQQQQLPPKQFQTRY